MHKARKKIIFSTFSIIVFMITLFATTYAWVGIFTYASTGSFNINLKVNELDANYFLVVSSSGEYNKEKKINTFGDEVPLDDIRLQCIKNFGKDTSNLTTSKVIESTYQYLTSTLSPVSTAIKDDNSFDTFYKFDPYNRNSTIYPDGQYTASFVESNEYLKFDLYFSVDTKEGINQDTEINSNIFITDLENMLFGSECSHQLIKNNFTDIDYPSQSSDKLISDLLPTTQLLKNLSIEKLVKVNSKNAIRVGFELYEPIPIENQYNGTECVLASKIYQGGNLIPSLDDDGVYDLGGIIPNDYNTALQEIRNVKEHIIINVPDEAINRGDLEINEANSLVWKKPTDVNEKILGVHNGVRTKMKVTVYLWYEGWDADCLLGLSKSNVELNLTFTAGTNND